MLGPRLLLDSGPPCPAPRAVLARAIVSRPGREVIAGQTRPPWRAKELTWNAAPTVPATRIVGLDTEPADTPAMIDTLTAPAVADASLAPAGCSAAVQARGLLAKAFALLNADPTVAQAHADQALALLDAVAEPSLCAEARHVLGMAECMQGRVAPGASLLQDAAAALHRHGPAQAECRVLRDLGAVLTNLTGDLQGAVEALERALVLAEALGDRYEQGMVLARLGPLFGRLGRLDDAETKLRAALQCLADGPDRRSHGTTLVNLGYVQIQRGAFEQAVPLLHRALGLLDAVGDRLWRINAQSNLAIAWAGSGQADDALRLLDDIGTRLNPSTDGYQWADHLLTCGRVRLMCGDAPGARTQLTEGLSFAQAQALHAAEIDLLDRLSEAEEGCGDLAAALAHQRALRVAERRWLDEQTAGRVRVLQASIELAEQRAENKGLERLRAELEQRVQERTEALSKQVREREAAEALARYWAEHDWLTRLPNRHRLQTDVAAALLQAQLDGTQLGLLFIDLDGFKAVNDAHGHLSGDRLLRATAHRLVKVAPTGATVTRFGGDEFVVLLPGLNGGDAATVVAQALRAAVMAPLRLSGRRVSLSCSIGVAHGPRDARTADELVRAADRAMLEAKAGGRNQVCALDIDGQQRLDRRGRLRRELGDALDRGRLRAAFQPSVDLRTGLVAGVELLARWHDPEMGSVSPAEFIPLAEESGLISALGTWALREGLRAARALRCRGQLLAGSVARVAINVSPVQLADADLVQTLMDVVLAEGGDPRWIELELTESVQLAEDASCLERLRQLRELGFHLALDDFGAGYSSFSYLSRLYFERLKIDRALVQAAQHAPERSAVTASIIAMAHGLGLTVVAEGIETPAQRALLAQQGCDVIQGYLIARPMPLEALLVWRPAS